MRKFTLDFYVKPLLVLYIVICIVASIMVLGVEQIFSTEMLCIYGLLMLFGFYVLCTFIAITRDKFKEVSIDAENERFILTAKNGQIMAIPFNNLESVLIQQGEILRGIRCAHIAFVTQDKKAFGLTISHSNTFYVSLPKYVKQSMEEKIFYSPKWNNV